MADSALLNAIRATPLPSHMESYGQGDPSVMVPALGKEILNIAKRYLKK